MVARRAAAGGSGRPAHIVYVNQFNESKHPRGAGGKFAVKQQAEQPTALVAVPSSAADLAGQWGQPLEQRYVDAVRERFPNVSDADADLVGRLTRRSEQVAQFFETNGDAGVADAKENAPELVFDGVDDPARLAQSWRRQADRDLHPWGGAYRRDPWGDVPVSPAIPGADTPNSAAIAARSAAADAWDDLDEKDPEGDPNSLWGPPSGTRSAVDVTSDDIVSAYNAPVPVKLRTLIQIARPDANPGEVDGIGRQMRHATRIARWFDEGGVDAMTDAEANKPEWILAPPNTEDWWEWSQANAREWEQRLESLPGRPPQTWFDEQHTTTREQAAS